MRKKIKRCNICIRKKDGRETELWSGCPKSPNYEKAAKEPEKPKENEAEKGKK